LNTADTRPADAGNTPAAPEALAIAGAPTDRERITLTARWILREFDAYYLESRQIPALARAAFEQRDPRATLALSGRRLSIYNDSINALGPALMRAFPVLADIERLWHGVEREYVPLIAGRYEADLAFAYLHSVHRKLYQGEWKPVEYAFEATVQATGKQPNVHLTYPGGPQVRPETVEEILRMPGFSVPYRHLAEDAWLACERINRITAGDRVRRIEMVDAAFYRNRGCYLIGRMVLEDMLQVPLIFVLLNSEQGVYVDALLHSEADAHNLFSSTWANFMVTNARYHELVAFLHRLMPHRPEGLLYTTIGFNHVGKVAVMKDLRAEVEATGERFETSAGFKGSVAIGFSVPSSSYNLKVIRDVPTDQYKWGTFPGLDAVLAKYGRVHEMDRSGSMLDNVIYYNLKLERSLFDPELLDELLEHAARSVSLSGDAVIFKYLIVQRKVTPLPVYLENAPPEESERVIVELGYTIKNNMAAHIVNKDLDMRNYGVGRYGRVILFDFDALEWLTEVKIRTNIGREDGEEDIPDWYFEEGVVFLPEELGSGLLLPNRHLHRLFCEAHADLLTTRYWEEIQQAFLAGQVPRVRVYPEERKLRRHTAEYLEGSE